MGSSPVNSAEFVTTRFAPSPTGRLHLGHALSAIRAHDFARARGGRFLLRIEDIDMGRSRPEHVAGIVEDLRWLGLDWDDLSHQSARLASYQAALDGLKSFRLYREAGCLLAQSTQNAAKNGNSSTPQTARYCLAQAAMSTNSGWVPIILFLQNWLIYTAQRHVSLLSSQRDAPAVELTADVQ